jgi:hypothetical protein
VAQPKVYGFDTGFVAYARGWNDLRSEDCGQLWEHLVLDTMLAIPPLRLHFWRDKQQREVDFVLPRGRDQVDALECKWNADSFEPRGLSAFRASYPKGLNFVVSPAIQTAYVQQRGPLTIHFLPIAELRAIMGEPFPETSKSSRGP